MFSTITSYQLVEDAHLCLILSSELNLEDKMGVKAGTVKEDFVPKHDMVDGVVFPDCLRATRAVNWDVGTRGVFRRLLG